MDKTDRHFLTAIKRKWWYLTLLIASTIYLIVKGNSISDLTILTVQNLILYIWLVLLLFPLFSEMEFMGIKLKKEVEKAAKEVKDTVSELKIQIMELRLSNSNANSLSLTFSGDVPSRKELSEVMNGQRSQGDEIVKPINPDEIVTDETVYLFKVRLTIEQALRKFCDRLNYDGRCGIDRLLGYSVECGLLDRKTADYAKQIIAICNRGIHGEIVSNEYIEFVKSMLPKVLRQINETTSRLGYKFYFVCPRCKYSGYSEYENVCPDCGFISDDK